MSFSISRINSGSARCARRLFDGRNETRSTEGSNRRILSRELVDGRRCAVNHQRLRSKYHRLSKNIAILGSGEANQFSGQDPAIGPTPSVLRVSFLPSNICEAHEPDRC